MALQEEGKVAQTIQEKLRAKLQWASGQEHFQKYEAELSKIKEKMTIQEGHEEQQGTQSKSQETLMAELQAERNKTTALHEELQNLQTSYQDVNYKYEAEAATNIKVQNNFKEEKRALQKTP